MTSSSMRFAPPIAEAILALPFMQEWIVAARTEPEELEELDVEF